MSYPDADWPAQRRPEIPVIVRNAADLKTPQLRPTKTTAQIFIVDGSNADPSKRTMQVAGYEPTRRRIAIHAYDSAVNVVFGDVPKVSPDTSAGGPPATAPTQGITVPGNDSARPWEFFGCDAVWLNAASSTPTRVAVIKEYE